MGRTADVRPNAGCRLPPSTQRTVNSGQLLDDKRETTSASARITPQRHFSQIICRTDAVQLCAASAVVPGVVRVTALSAGVAGLAGDGPAGTAGGAEEGVMVGVEEEEAGVEGAGDVPRSFCAMFGTSRMVGVQYCGSRCAH